MNEVEPSNKRLGVSVVGAVDAPLFQSVDRCNEASCSERKVRHRERLWLKERKFPDPPDRSELGVCCWSILHAAAAHADQKNVSLGNWLSSFFSLYPCKECRQHVEVHVREVAPPTASSSYSMWVCECHNFVNERLGREQFPCDHFNLMRLYGGNYTVRRPASEL